MLAQLRHEFKSGRSELCAEKEIKNDWDFFVLFKETEETHPLPERARWVLCLVDHKTECYFNAEDVRSPNEDLTIGETLLKKLKGEKL